MSEWFSRQALGSLPADAARRWSAREALSFQGRRWTFAVGPLAPDYAAYLRGLAELVTAGLVAVSPENGQCLLTNEGLAYCNAHADELGGAEIYAF